ncbi:unnamed protein product [Brassica rapa]|uniref:Uncharacterized protein n=1 Tax=Brassica campestris TaxID=3711 RepID=A0A8D9H6G6_BRACM|nr:unnamed protein product [Brassica rapa]
MSEGAMHYIILEPASIPLAADFYVEVFQATRVFNYPDGSIQLKIFDSYVLLTPGTSNSVVIELVIDGGSLQSIRQDPRFMVMLLESDLEKERAMVKIRDNFGVYWLLTQKKYSDLYRHLDSCERCNLDRHLPALCHEMKTWALCLDQPNLILEGSVLYDTVVIYRRLQKEMLRIRKLRLLYESEDFVLFTNHPCLRAIFDELERINSFRQSLTVALFLNPKMIEVDNLATRKDSVDFYAPLVLYAIHPPSPNNPPVYPGLLSLRSRLCDSFRQLVKRLQTARTIMNHPRLPTQQERWMANILYNDVDYWRTQNY